MIARLRGAVLALKPPVAVIDVGGVGFKVACSQAACEEMTVGRNIDLHTHLIVREDDLSLYGFASEDECALFQLLLTVSGVGARTALAVLSRLSPDAARAAIAGGQIDTLSRVPGIGRKTAEKLVFALRDKLGGLDLAPASSLSAGDTEVIAALTSLGYSISEAQAALAALPRDGKLDLEEKLRMALQKLG
ncbi:MAG: Holliday junction branch migration protein RuvA [Thermoflexales bacterium]|nr:Holliday junction branch migration protein RuvA [Thermoflexales bacterium]